MSEEKLSVFPMGEKNDAYARYFVGQRDKVIRV